MHFTLLLSGRGRGSLEQSLSKVPIYNKQAVTDVGFVI